MPVIILLSLAVWFLLNAWYKRTNHFNNQFVDVRKYWNMEKFPQGLQLVNLGSNHPKFGFDYSETDLRAMNCAVGPQTFEYDYAILRKISPYLAPGACIIIPVCLLKFFLFRQKSRATHVKYYTFLSEQDIVDYSQMEKMKSLQFPLFFHPQYLRYLIRDVPRDSRLELTENPLKDSTTLEQDADKWIRCWNKEFNITLPTPTLSRENEEDIEHNIYLLQEMLEYCTAHQFKPLIAILPVTGHLSSHFTDDFIQNHILRYIQQANTVGAPLLNYLHDARFTAPELYINSFFMNKRGRQLFTKRLLSDMKNALTKESQNTWCIKKKSFSLHPYKQ